MADGEFMLAARHWHGGLKLNIGDQTLAIFLNDGVVSDSPDEPAKIISYSADAAVWQRLLQAVPPRFHNDLLANLSAGLGITREGDPLLHAQYFAAVVRAVELLRPPTQYDQAIPHLIKQRVSLTRQSAGTCTLSFRDTTTGSTLKKLEKVFHYCCNTPLALMAVNGATYSRFPKSPIGSD